MSKVKIFLAISLFAITGVLSANAQQLAFPGAAGWGRWAKGARASSAPTVYHVTNLNDSGSGSLRDAVSSPNRIVVFDVSGVIKLNSRIVFAKNLYVAGQTAPGEGITVYGNGVSFSGSNDIICRYLRVRMGHKGDSGKDCAGVANGTNMIFDHCSFSWGLDETFSINPDGKGDLRSITIMNTIMGQGLMTHSAGGLMQADSITLYRNLYVDNSTRNNKVKGINQYANNVVYNWQNGCYIMGGDSQGTSYVNIEGNLFINGPAKGGTAFGGGNSDFHFYGEDNWQDSNMDGKYNPALMTATGGGDKVSKPYPYPYLELYPGDKLLELNIPSVGASLPYRDQSDFYMIDELMSLGKAGALISNEESLPIGAPDTWSWWQGTKKTDSDGDGMPDEWEDANGTDKAKNDATAYAANGYLNIENYINSISIEGREFFLRQPITLGEQKSTTSTITVSWRDYTDAEDGFAVEIAPDGSSSFTEVGTAAANATSFVISGLKDGSFYNVRVRAFATRNGEKKYSEYATARVSTRPAEADIVDIDAFNPDVTLGETQTVWDLSTTDWKENKTFNDGDNVLLNTDTDQELTINGTMLPGDVVVNGTGKLTINGIIAGDGTSVNKGNTGTLVLNGANKYTGATVLYDGVLEFNSIANGGAASAIGASQNFSQNWIFDGGTYRYTGSSASTDRNAQVKSASALEISKASTVTMNGAFEGSGSMTFDGAGTIQIPTTKFFDYSGTTTLKGGTLYLSTVDAAKKGIGSSSKLILAGGTLKTKGETSNYETYTFPMEVEEGTYSVFAPNRNCYIRNKISGAGTLEFDIPYVREYFDADLSNFTGKIVAWGKSSESGGSLFLSEKNMNMANTRLELKGNAHVCMWPTSGVGSIGGLSGDAGTYLMASSKKTNGATCSWTIGGANSDETFNGIINNQACSSGYTAKNNNITKVGTGIWRLTGKNVYVGTTTVNGGALIINGDQTSATGAYIVNSGATLQGQGIIGGTVTVNSGATLCAGDSLYTKYLTCKKAVTMKSGSRMKMAVSTLTGTKKHRSFKFSSTLKLEDGVTLEIDLTDVKEINDGDNYTVITTMPTSLTGEFSAIEPAIPAEGYSWDTSDLYSSGKIYVVKDSVPTDPVGIEAVTRTVEHQPLQGTFDLQGKRISPAEATGIVVTRGKKYVTE